MNIVNILRHFVQVEQIGPNRWMASCPTRPDKQRSLSIIELSDGRIQLHDFGGDSTEHILDAVGLDMSDLYPDILMYEEFNPEGNPFSGEGAKRCLYSDAMVVYAAALTLREGNSLSDADFDQLKLAAQCIDDVMRVLWLR
jgi:hypothetical protein